MFDEDLPELAFDEIDQVEELWYPEAVDGKPMEEDFNPFLYSLRAENDVKGSQTEEAVWLAQQHHARNKLKLTRYSREGLTGSA